jgi:hypothetical protein
VRAWVAAGEDRISFRVAAAAGTVSHTIMHAAPTHPELRFAFPTEEQVRKHAADRKATGQRFLHAPVAHWGPMARASAGKAAAAAEASKAGAGGGGGGGDGGAGGHAKRKRTALEGGDGDEGGAAPPAAAPAPATKRARPGEAADTDDSST